MFDAGPEVKIYVATEPVDMRKSFTGLAKAVVEIVGRDPYSGHLFAFLNRRRNLLKVLSWDENGFCLLCKRLSGGVDGGGGQKPRPGHGLYPVEATQGSPYHGPKAARRDARRPPRVRARTMNAALMCAFVLSLHADRACDLTDVRDGFGGGQDSATGRVDVRDGFGGGQDSATGRVDGPDSRDPRRAHRRGPLGRGD
jgi:hypothetical protein